jgi:hypothetical protein
MAQGEVSAADLTAFQHMVEEEERYPSFLIAARGERACIDVELQAVEDGKVSMVQFNQSINRRPTWNLRQLDDVLYRVSPGSLRANRASLLTNLNRLVEIAKLPVEEQAEALKALETAQQKSPPLASALLHSWLSRLGAAYQLSRAELRCGAAAIAAERFRARHGHWPGSLQDLVPELLARVPMDPYDGAPLRLRRLADGLAVYTVGPDLQDNGGSLPRRPLSGITEPAPLTDVGFRLWDVPSRRRMPTVAK